MDAPKKTTPQVIAIRRTCKAEGVGLSHFVPPARPVERARPQAKVPRPAAKP